jgi:hypothetical protein
MLDVKTGAHEDSAAASSQELIARAEALVPLLRENGPKTEQLRCLTEDSSRTLVERLLALCPSSEVHRAKPIQRLLRDMHVFEHQHAATPFANYELFGRKFVAAS